MSIATTRRIYHLTGLSTDTKPIPDDISTGSTFIETDTGATFVFNRTTSSWVMVEEQELPTVDAPCLGIKSIKKTSSAGLVDTYTIFYTNGAQTTFEVTNGTKVKLNPNIKTETLIPNKLYSISENNGAAKSVTAVLSLSGQLINNKITSETIPHTYYWPKDANGDGKFIVSTNNLSIIFTATNAIKDKPTTWQGFVVAEDGTFDRYVGKFVYEKPYDVTNSDYHFEAVKQAVNFATLTADIAEANADIEVLDNALLAENTRATEKENELEAAIDAETTRAENSETAIRELLNQKFIDLEEVDRRLDEADRHFAVVDAELTERIDNVENELNTKIDTDISTLTARVAKEEARAIITEKVIDNKYGVSIEALENGKADRNNPLQNITANSIKVNTIAANSNNANKLIVAAEDLSINSEKISTDADTINISADDEIYIKTDKITTRLTSPNSSSCVGTIQQVNTGNSLKSVTKLENGQNETLSALTLTDTLGQISVMSNIDSDDKHTGQIVVTNNTITASVGIREDESTEIVINKNKVAVNHNGDAILTIDDESTGYTITGGRDKDLGIETYEMLKFNANGVSFDTRNIILEDATFDIKGGTVNKIINVSTKDQITTKATATTLITEDFSIGADSNNPMLQLIDSDDAHKLNINLKSDSVLDTKATSVNILTEDQITAKANKTEIVTKDFNIKADSNYSPMVQLTDSDTAQELNIKLVGDSVLKTNAVDTNIVTEDLMVKANNVSLKTDNIQLGTKATPAAKLSYSTEDAFYDLAIDLGSDSTLELATDEATMTIDSIVLDTNTIYFEQDLNFIVRDDHEASLITSTQRINTEPVGSINQICFESFNGTVPATTNFKFSAGANIAAEKTVTIKSEEDIILLAKQDIAIGNSNTHYINLETDSDSAITLKSHQIELTGKGDEDSIEINSERITLNNGDAQVIQVADGMATITNTNIANENVTNSNITTATITTVYTNTLKSVADNHDVFTLNVPTVKDGTIALISDVTAAKEEAINTAVSSITVNYTTESDLNAMLVNVFKETTENKEETE